MILSYKILRGSAWLLALAAILTLLSGFIMAKNFLFPGVSYDFSLYFHTVIIPLIFLPLFYVHSLFGFLNLVKRHRILNHKSLKIIFAVVWTGFLVFFGWFYLVKNPLVANAGPGNNPAAIAGNVTLTADEVAKHNSPSDCWLIISGSVYNVTNFLGVHPGGPGAITPYCGKDATTVFATKNQGTPHSSTAASLLNSFYLGKVGETVSGTAVQSVQNQPVPNVSSETENGDD